MQFALRSASHGSVGGSNDSVYPSTSLKSMNGRAKARPHPVGAVPAVSARTARTGTMTAHFQEELRATMSKPAKPSLHRDAWLKQALDVLFSHGIASVKVEILARELAVTKGSFYWHFKNRDELLHQMVDWWRDNQIGFIEGLDVKHITDAPNLIKSVIEFTHHTDDSRHDVAMREFARFDQYAAVAVADIDRRRIDYLCALFKAADFDDAEALLRAQALYFYQVGEYTTSLTMDAELRDDLAERRFRLLISHAADRR